MTIRPLSLASFARALDTISLDLGRAKLQSAKANLNEKVSEIELRSLKEQLQMLTLLVDSMGGFLPQLESKEADKRKIEGFRHEISALQNPDTGLGCVQRCIAEMSKRAKAQARHQQPPLNGRVTMVGVLVRSSLEAARQMPSPQSAPSLTHIASRSPVDQTALLRTSVQECDLEIERLTQVIAEATRDRDAAKKAYRQTGFPEDPNLYKNVNGQVWQGDIPVVYSEAEQSELFRQWQDLGKKVDRHTSHKKADEIERDACLAEIARCQNALPTKKQLIDPTKQQLINARYTELHAQFEAETEELNHQIGALEKELAEGRKQYETQLAQLESEQGVREEIEALQAKTQGYRSLTNNEVELFRTEKRAIGLYIAETQPSNLAESPAYVRQQRLETLFTQNDEIIFLKQLQSQVGGNAPTLAEIKQQLENLREHQAQAEVAGDSRRVQLHQKLDGLSDLYQRYFDAFKRSLETPRNVPSPAAATTPPQEGVHVKAAPQQDKTLMQQFMDATGAYLKQKKELEQQGDSEKLETLEEEWQAQSAWFLLALEDQKAVKAPVRDPSLEAAGRKTDGKPLSDEKSYKFLKQAVALIEQKQGPECKEAERLLRERYLNVSDTVKQKMQWDAQKGTLDNFLRLAKLVLALVFLEDRARDRAKEEEEVRPTPETPPIRGVVNEQAAPRVSPREEVRPTPEKTPPPTRVVNEQAPRVSPRELARRPVDTHHLSLSQRGKIMHQHPTPPSSVSSFETTSRQRSSYQPAIRMTSSQEKKNYQPAISNGAPTHAGRVYQPAIQGRRTSASSQVFQPAIRGSQHQTASKAKQPLIG